MYLHMCTFIDVINFLLSMQHQTSYKCRPILTSEVSATPSETRNLKLHIGEIIIIEISSMQL